MSIRIGAGRFFPAPALKTTKTKVFGFAEGFIVGGFTILDINVLQIYVIITQLML